MDNLFIVTLSCVNRVAFFAMALVSEMLPPGYIEIVYGQNLFTSRALPMCGCVVWIGEFSSLMMAHMRAHIHNFKIFYAVIQFIFVNMMHAFMRCKPSAQMLLHNVAMLEHAATIHVYFTIMHPFGLGWFHHKKANIAVYSNEYTYNDEKFLHLFPNRLRSICG